MQFHVSMEDMNASIATMTANGIPSARQAVTDFNQGLSVMYGNIGTVTKSLEKNGIAFDETKFNAASYTDKILMMNKALQDSRRQACAYYWRDEAGSARDTNSRSTHR